MPRLDLTLPLPPSSNRYWRVYQGHATLSADARQYVADVGYRLTGLRGPTAGEPVALSARVYCQIARDLDNTSKVLVDSLARALEWDDKRLMALHLTKHLTPRTAERRVEVTLTWGDDAGADRTDEQE